MYMHLETVTKVWSLKAGVVFFEANQTICQNCTVAQNLFQKPNDIKTLFKAICFLIVHKAAYDKNTESEKNFIGRFWYTVKKKKTLL